MDAIEAFAPLSIQEPWDNSGLQVGTEADVCSGVLLCVDVTEKIVDEAIKLGCNLIVSHHPLLFRGLKEINPDKSGVQEIVYKAIKAGVAIYSAHTSLDKAQNGISYRMAHMLGADVVHPLVPDNPGADTGLGVVATFGVTTSARSFINRIREAFGNPRIRCSNADNFITVFAVCSGSGGEFIPNAIDGNCDAYITSEVRYHDFVDYGNRILIADIGHFESEECAKDIFYDIISEKFPNFAVYKSEIERNPIKYL